MIVIHSGVALLIYNCTASAWCDLSCEFLFFKRFLTVQVYYFCSTDNWKFAAEQFVRMLPDKVFVHRKQHSLCLPEFLVSLCLETQLSLPVTTSCCPCLFFLLIYSFFSELRLIFFHSVLHMCVY